MYSPNIVKIIELLLDEWKTNDEVAYEIGVKSNRGIGAIRTAMGVKVRKTMLRKSDISIVMDRNISPSQAAEILGCPISQIYRYRKDNGYYYMYRKRRYAKTTSSKDL